MTEYVRAVAVLIVTAAVGGLVSVLISSGAGSDETLDRPGRDSAGGGRRENLVIGLEGDNWVLTNSNGSVSVPSAVVPGNMYTALMAAGVIGDPYYRFNDDVYRWVHWDDWTYTTTFEASAEFAGQPAVRLVAESLDTIASVYVNDQLVGTAANQFVRYVFDITAAVQVGTNTVRIAFTSAPQFAKTAFDSHAYRIPPDCPPPEYHPECHVNMIRKAACSFSWDWGPSFATQGINAGIWVESNDVAKIRDVIPHTERDFFSTPIWTLNVTVILDIAGTSFQGDVIVEFPEMGLLFEANDVTISSGDGKISLANLDVPAAESWWPRGYGIQKMYDLVVTLRDASAAQVDTKSVRMAFRTVETVEETIATGYTFYFRVNQVPIYMKGSNWIPVDSFLDRVTPERLRRLLDSATLTNMNTIRIWGGGVYETDAYYDIADELGILIWQDLMFACNMYPVDAAFLTNVEDEMIYQVRRLARHPSVVAWTANNENEGALVDDWYGTAGPLYDRYKEDYVMLYADTMRRTILQEDYTRPFLPSSPTNGRLTEENGWISEDPKPSSPDYGDIHYYNYLDDCLDHKIYLPTRYSSEYGYQSWPSYNTLSKVAEPTDLYYGSPLAQHRQHHPGAGNGTEQIVRRHFTWPDSGDVYADFPNIIYLTQAAQAMCYKVQTEHYRRAQSDPDIRTMGALYWQHNDIWQAPSWATIDVEGNWKMAHYYARHFFADPIVSSIEDDPDVLSVYTVTDSYDDVTANLVIKLWRWDSSLGSPLFTWNIPTTVDGPGASVAYTAALTDMFTEGGCVESPRTSCLFTMYLETTTDATWISPVNPFYPASWKDAQGLAPPGIQIQDVVETSPSRQFDVTLTTNRIAAFVWLEAANVPGYFSDNGFLWTDSVSVTLTFTAWEDVLLADFVASLSVNSLADIY